MAVDHVVIGSGINGLVAASLLALKGYRVLVLERESVPGGCMRTEELATGYLHNVMAATFVLFMTSPAGAALGPTWPATASTTATRRTRPPCCGRGARRRCWRWTGRPI